MKIQFKVMMLSAGLLSLVLVSCRKDKEEERDSDTTSAVEYAIGENAFNDVANIADEAYDGSLDSYRTSSGSGTLSTCATISFDSLTAPKSLTVDFGTADCLCSDGNYRRGKIIVTWTGPYRDSGSVRTITFDNYYVNYNKIQGTKTVTNNGTNVSGHPVYSVSVNGSIVWDSSYFGGGGTSTYTSSRTREWISGYNTLNWLDDVYLISGTASGTTRLGNAYTMSTSEALKKEIGFRHFTDGVLNFTPAGKYTRVIDYGYVNGGRDNLAQVTINGFTFNIQLR